MTCIAFTPRLPGSGSVKISSKKEKPGEIKRRGKGQRREVYERHLPECSVCLAHFTFSGDQTEAGLYPRPPPSLSTNWVQQASARLREEADVTRRVDSAGSRSLGVNELLGRRVHDGQGFQESRAVPHRPVHEVGKQKMGA